MSESSHPAGGVSGGFFPGSEFGAVTFHIANLSPPQAVFLTGVARLFTDPAESRNLADLMACRAGLFMDAHTGECLVSNLFRPNVPEKTKTQNQG